MEDREILELIQNANRLDNWIPKKIFLQFNDAQYKALLKGYKVHWDMRYGIHIMGDYFYIHRSGHVVGKFKVENIEDDLYRVAEMYDNPESGFWYYVFDTLVEACKQNRIPIDRDNLCLMQEKTYKMQEEN